MEGEEQVKKDIKEKTDQKILILKDWITEAVKYPIPAAEQIRTQEKKNETICNRSRL